MLGIIVVTHSDLASGLRGALEMILGEQEDLDVVCFREGEDLMGLIDRVKALAVRYIEAGEKFVVCVDLYCATPFNAAAAALADCDASIITGVNLPALVQLVTERDSCEDYDSFIDSVAQSAKDGLQVIKTREMFG